MISLDNWDIEFRAVWPNGNLVDHVGEPKQNRENFFYLFDNYCNALQSLQVPREYFPRVEARIMEPDSRWKMYGDIERELILRERMPKPEEPAQYPTAKHREPAHEWAPTDRQIQQVKKRQFGWDDPCILCGVRFRECKHKPWETESYVNSVKEWLKGQL
jgi:hypothetical protein